RGHLRGCECRCCACRSPCFCRGAYTAQYANRRTKDKGPMTVPDWQLPPGVDRGLWDYLHAADMVAGYDEQMRASHLARVDVTFCERAFPTPGRLLDLGCGTGRLCAQFAAKGFECVGADLSEEMLAKARTNAPSATFVKANL